MSLTDSIPNNVDLGADKFILSSYPHLEECYRVAETVLPLEGQVPVGGPDQQSGVDQPVEQRHRLFGSLHDELAQIECPQPLFAVSECLR